MIPVKTYNGSLPEISFGGEKERPMGPTLLLLALAVSIYEVVT